MRKITSPAVIWPIPMVLISTARALVSGMVPLTGGSSLENGLERRSLVTNQPCGR
jgi:hypothetical protein